MGRGGYNGGSTVVGGFGWSSYDPASGGRIVKKRPIKPNQPSSQTAKKNPLSVPPAKKKPHKEKLPANLHLLRLTYLEAIIDAALRAQPAPVPPKRARVHLNAATISAGGPVQWAKAQREYATTLERKQRQLARKAQTPVEGGRRVFVAETRVCKPVIHASGSKSLPVIQISRASIDILCRERARLSTALTAAEAEVRRHKEAIAVIDRKLAAANSSRR